MSDSRGGRRIATALSISALVAAPLAFVTAAPAQAADPVDVTILATNDFHGRIQSNRLEAGAAVLSGAVKQLREANPHTTFAAAGDLIGASTFESFIAEDKPTIDALNAAGLEVSAVGNHEFDQGYDDLVNRVMNPAAPLGGAKWKYLGANVRMKANPASPALEESWIKDFGPVQVGFVGAVTEHLDELVSPGGISSITVTDVVAATNREAAELTAAGADAVVLLVHEGAPSTDCAAMDDDPASDFGSIVTGVSADVDAIVSGHTHLAYACTINGRPVVSAGQYGMNLNQITMSVTDGVGVNAVKTNKILPLVTEGEDASGESTYTPNYPADPAVQAIVDAAVAAAEVLGARPLGDIGHAFKRAMKADGSENRGGESTLGNLVAEVHRWATRTKTAGTARIAFMNPGGLRADMLGDRADGYPAEVTYKQAATVQPFANTLVNMELTGRQIRKVLEEQWQPQGSSRPFLRLGVSKGFSYTYDPHGKPGRRIQKMWLRGDRVRGRESYSVTVNSFLANGGDNFSTFADGTDRQDTGKTDLQAMVDYLARKSAKKPVSPSWKQGAVGVTWKTDGVVRPGDRAVRFNLTSWSFSARGDLKDRKVVVRLGRQKLGTFKVDNSRPDAESAQASYDELGKVKVRLRVPRGPGATVSLKVRGTRTGTTLEIPVKIRRR